MLLAVHKAGHFGPLFGGAMGIIPQCGFAAASSGLYAARVISLGTLMSIYLSTSDEMLPIVIAGGAPFPVIVKILAIKLSLGVGLGFLVDFILRLFHNEAAEHDECVADFCREHTCHCERGIWRSTLHHTLQISLFLLLTSLALNSLFFLIGEDALRNLFTSLPIVSNLLSALIGLVPNCASSVVITNLYMEGMISAGAMFSGLLTGCGVGLLVLFRTRKDFKKNLAVLGLLYGIGAICGILLDAIRIGAFLH